MKDPEQSWTQDPRVSGVQIGRVGIFGSRYYFQLFDVPRKGINAVVVSGCSFPPRLQLTTLGQDLPSKVSSAVG